jgi:transcriptional regulator with XRE-family HTH domain
MINKALKVIRQFHKIKQSDLAIELGISKSYLSEIESGKKPVSFEILEKYSLSFDIPVSSLVFFSENMENEGKLAKNFRLAVTEKIIKVMEWLTDKNEAKNQEV